MGNEIATIVNEEKPAGSYEVNFDAMELTSGIYFYQLKAGTFVQTKKMVIIR
ncbi:MAG: T9SS type A sorting domain-containing protein [Ignavibacteriaceae bacterium]